VTYVDIETEEQVQVADTFAAFLDGLVDEVETRAFRIAADVSLDAFAHVLATVTGYEVTDQGDWSHGYQQLRARLSGGGWMWVSPNRVPRWV